MVGMAARAYSPMAPWSFTFSVKMAYPFGMRSPSASMALKPRPDHCCIQKDACPPPGFPCTCQENRALELSDLKKALEGTTMSKPEFVYPTYIRSTPERLWQGLT